MNRRRSTPDDQPGGMTYRPFAALRASTGSQPADEAPRTPAVPGAGRIVVRREKKGRAGKTVTRVYGAGLEAPVLERLTRDLKRALGCGASIEEGEIVLQGDMTQRAAAWLRARTGADVTVGN